ncbi:Adenylate kinase [Stieleria bergensis]|uniref:Adenylate kinase n=1 Tax=Stieleria bergensis TaxID=2528025 RepID=A0A517SRG9_9BACT|nr:Adenylate kinase [Planctomycetes bacterium SV_7m_r]
MRLLLIGPPGVGKGTQGRLLAQQLGIPHLSSGQLLRDARNQSAENEAIASHVDSGNFAPDQWILNLMGQRLEQPDCSAGYLLDGFPRTVVQAQQLDEHLHASGQRLDRVVQYLAPDEVLIARLLHRGTVEGRADDNQQAIEQRLVDYQRQTEPVIEHYRQQGIVVVIEATADPESIAGETLRQLSIDP